MYRIEDYAAKAREVAAEGIVLLKNDHQALPLCCGDKVAFFGRSQFNYFKSGTGSGGLVNTPYVWGVREALHEETDIELNEMLEETYASWIKEHPYDNGHGWGSEPWFQEEMPLTEELVSRVREQSDTALVVIGRSAGEDHDNDLKEGSYLLTQKEEDMLAKICAAFTRTIVLLNVGNVIDMNWVERYNPAAVAYIWQGGQEGGLGVADMLMGRVTPSGKLPDSIVKQVQLSPAARYFGNPDKVYYTEDIYVGYRYYETFHPEEVIYPFGFGLSYTDFAFKGMKADADLKDGRLVKISCRADVENIGAVDGKEVLQVYVAAPQGKLGKAKRSLCGFKKTALLAPGQTQHLELTIAPETIASYDDRSATAYPYAYVLEEGTYEVYAGSDVRSARLIGSFTLDEIQLVEQLSQNVAPEEDFDILRPCEDADGCLKEMYIPVVKRQTPYAEVVKKDDSREILLTGDQGYRLIDVQQGKVSMEAFIAQLSVEDLASLSRGEGMCSPKVTAGIAGAFGGVTDNLQKFGLPIAGCSDGPSGIRMDSGAYAFSMPNGTLLASTFDPELSEDMYEWEGLELRKNKIDTLLGPGLNIHRYPLNGRNFEYFSEDPYLTGKMAAAQLRGMGRHRVTGTIKHFATNNQETNRHGAESIVSERALREIYLKGFEIAVKEGGAYSIMSTYNPLNGHWTASHYELLTGILRKEWGYQGIVMTDWWAKGNYPGEDGYLKNTAAKIQAQNDVSMVNLNAANQESDNTLEGYREGKVTLADLQRMAKNVCSYLLRTPAYDRMVSGGTLPLDAELKEFVFEGEDTPAAEITWNLDESDTLPGTELIREKDATNLITLLMKTRGRYRLILTCRTEEGIPEMAQIPVSIFQDKTLVKTITLTGLDHDWKTFEIEEELGVFFMSIMYLKLRFAQTGMEVKELKMELVENMEDTFWNA